ncbi:MAG: polyprenyl synthetase family protein [Firmicutes bacterium]|nr:polyprenyl synthetase family protein [Bacillota bacterium]
MNLNNELTRLKELVEKELDKTLPKVEGEQKNVIESMRYSAFAGGKRLRPILVLKSCELVGGNIKDAMPFALALEMIHTYSLIHDDLPAMDDDDYRRGKPTNHKVYGESIAILAGDGLLNCAYETMINHITENIEDSKKYIKAFTVIAKASGVYGMIGGQVVDIMSESNSFNEKTLDFIHKHKTSALIEASIIAGGLIGDANKEELKRLKEYGKAIGLSFQIRDDILDIIGNKEKLGKDIGSDQSNKKATFVSLYGLEESERKTEKLCKKAINSLDIFKGDNKLFFKDLAEYLVLRDY